MGSAATISLSLLEQVLSVQTRSECSPDKLFPGPPRLATAWLCPAEVSLCQLQTLRETWSTSQTESAPSTSLQCAWEFSPRNGSPPCTLRPALPGPTWLFGVSTFLASKEYFVMEHDFYVGIGLAVVLTGVVKSVGPDWTAAINKELDEEEAALKAIRQGEIDAIKATVAAEEASQADTSAYLDIVAAKKEAVGLQLEAVYRGRLQEAYTQVKKRLDYQLETANVVRRMEQKHMVDWIIGNVKSSITPAQEDAALKKCISDLKGLSSA